MQAFETINPGLNARTMELVHRIKREQDTLRVKFHSLDGGGSFIDCGVKAPGGFQAGLLLAGCTMGNLASIQMTSSHLNGFHGASIQVQTDHPVLSCLASQYAGWQIAVDDFFAMGSGPMRAHYSGEELFKHIPGSEKATEVVGVLETSATPKNGVFEYLANKMKVSPSQITLLGASTGSVAGSMQIVSRSVETALHKLHELKFPVECIQNGAGWAPLPPPTPKFTQAIGRTNDAILYGGLVHLWVHTEDEILEQVGSKVPACASGDYGAPFEEIFRRVNGDFYKIDPMLFSPAKICFMNQKNGKSFTFGKFDTDLLTKSWGR